MLGLGKGRIRKEIFGLFTPLFFSLNTISRTFHHAPIILIILLNSNFFLLKLFSYPFVIVVLVLHFHGIYIYFLVLILLSFVQPHQRKQFVFVCHSIIITTTQFDAKPSLLLFAMDTKTNMVSCINTKSAFCKKNFLMVFDSLLQYVNSYMLTIKDNAGD